MLVFIIPLRSAQTCDSWERVCKLFERSLRSACSQTSSEFQIFVVCHEIPDIQFSHQAVTYIQVDFTSPTKENISSRGETDRNRKIFTGLTQIRKSHASHVMFLDADDCVSNCLVEFVSNHPNEYGWVISKGYEYQETSNLVKHRKKQFQMRCGSSHIIRYDLVEQLINIHLEDVSSGFLQHREIEDIMKSKGTPLVELPFEGAIYITENSENFFNQEKFFLQRFRQGNSYWKHAFILYTGKIWKRITSKRLTNEIRDEFGIYNLS